ncbi:AtpZ/AtpI family protein [bacterium]|jgi:F0F1-type ATP synthase assembly protein I|nr:AtpZ/AtpI family protein [bacterium]MBT4121482.1 AtpZ/AtpI family protein [bacterium]MBT4335272.1 AtpZ/AtpI family protein [bacterium]MBT4495134.1 AtpZ/AtpI family protein [bacterium]MBT4764374.1 AtpZ/AtpI family protein [bacterium]
MNNLDNQQNNAWWQPAIAIFTQVTGYIAGPIIIALYLGKYLDEKYNSEPWIFLGLTAIAFTISCWGIVRIAIDYTNKIERELKEKDRNQNNESNSRTIR